MDKNELIEFVKLFKEATTGPVEESKNVDDNPVDAEPVSAVKTKTKKKGPSSFDSFEDRLFTLLLLLLTFIYFYLLATGQTFILQKEFEKFRESQKIIHFRVKKFFDEDAQVDGEAAAAAAAEAEYKSDKLKYEQYTAKNEFKLDLKVLGRNEIKCSVDLMKETAELIYEQMKLVKELEEDKTEEASLKDGGIKGEEKKKDNIKGDNVKRDNVKGDNKKEPPKETHHKIAHHRDTRNFNQFKSIYSPIQVPTVKYFDTFTGKLDLIYSKQIEGNFKGKLKRIQTNLIKEISLARQEILFLTALKKQTTQGSPDSSSSSIASSSYSTFKIKINSLLTLKEKSFSDYESNLKKLLDNLATTIESVPIYPSKKVKDKVQDKGKGKDEGEDEFYYLKFFEHLYTLG